jgi:hypothetical protein
MRFNQIVETTTAGSVATVAQPMMTQTRENVNIPGLKPVQQLMKGKSNKKGPYANSINEGKVKQLTIDLKELTDEEFKKKYGKTKVEIRSDMKKVNEDDLAEQDLIVIPGQGRLRRTGFVKQDLDQGEHEGHTLKNSLHTIARAASDLDKRLSVQSEFPEWVSEKIGAAKGMMVTVMDYLISSQEMQHDTDSMAEGSGQVYKIVAVDKGNAMSKPTKLTFKAGSIEEVFDSLAVNDWYPLEINGVEVINGKRLKQGVAEGRGFSGIGGARDREDDEHHHLDPSDWFVFKDGKMYKVSVYPNQHDSARSHGYSPSREEAKAKAARGSQDVAEGKIDFAKKLQKNVDKHNKAVVKTKQDIGSRVADIGAGGKEYNVKTDAAWDAAKKKVAEGSVPKEKQKTPYRDINSPEYKAAADKQKEKMAKDKEAEPGKKLADKIDNKKK